MEVVRQHEAMIAAIESRAVDHADTLARIHTELFRERINRYLNSNLAGTVSLGSTA
jgi:DNA-binding GntR family transcriptional regulator